MLIVTRQLGNYCTKMKNLFKVYLFKVTKFPPCSGIQILTLSNNFHLGQYKYCVLKYLPFNKNSYHKETNQLICNAKQLTDFSKIRVCTGKYFRLQYIFPYRENIVQEQEPQWKHWFEISGFHLPISISDKSYQNIH